MFPSVTVTPNSLMVLDTNLRENYVSQSQQIHLQENYNLKPGTKDELIPFGSHSSQGNFMQDFHHIDQFHHVHGSSSSNHQAFGVQTQNFDPFDNAACAQSDFEVYDGKYFASSDQNAHLIENFQYGHHGYNLNNNNNIPKRNHVDIMVENHSYFPFNNVPSETKPLNYVVAEDEVSSIAPTNYYQRNNRLLSPTTRRAFKARKKSNIVKGQWTVDEDRMLIQLVAQYGMRKWSHIAQKLPGRIGKQCRERWHNHLRPDIKKDIWTDEEDKILIQAHTEIGNKWAEIAKRLPGRTENSIKNHWNATKRRQYSKRKCRSKYPRGTLLQEYIKSLNLDQNPQRDFRRRSSSNAKKTITCSTSKAAQQTPQPQIASQFCPNDRSVPNYEFNDFCLDNNLFEEGCVIDSLLDDMSSVPTMDEKEFDDKQCDKGSMQEEHQFEMGIEVKKELDLVEMISQVNQSIN